MKKRSMNKKRGIQLILFIMGLLIFSNLSAQESVPIKLKGNVRDSKTQETLIGVSIVVKGKTIGTVTDSDGNFELEAPSNGTLVISYIGYLLQEIPISPKNKILTILLEENTELLDEVVVIGYGQVKKGDVTGALTSIKPNDENRGLQVNPQDALIGRVAGLSVVRGNGEPGSEGTIRIRAGASLFANNNPLIVVDGVPIEGASMSFINPNEVESYTVLKDASATAIYGSRASNGVLLITTKKGSAGTTVAPSFNYMSNYTISKLPSSAFEDVLTADEFRQAAADGKFKNLPTGYKLGTASTDWQKEVYHTGFSTDHTFTMTGTTKSVPYRVSAGYINQQGTLKNNDYQRYNAGIGLSPKFFDSHLALNINVRGIVEERTPPPGVIGSAISFDPTRPIYGEYPNNLNGFGYFMWKAADGKPITEAPTNPVSILDLIEQHSTNKRSVGNLSADYKIHGFEDLHLNLNLGYDVKKNDYKEFTPDGAPSTYTGIKNDGRGKTYFSSSTNTNYLLSTYANYIKDIDKKHNINVMAGYDWQRYWYDSSNRTEMLVLGDEVNDPYFDEDVLYLLSFYSRFNYSFDQKLLLTATLRADGSSRFAKENRWGYFPSLALAYRLSDENFMKDINWLSSLMLRVSYGKTGQQDIGGYHPYLPTYTISTNIARYAFGDQWLNMYRPNGYVRDITWEKTSTYNAGIDLGFLNNRITANLDVYKRYTKDLLNFVDQSAGSNFTNRLDANVGDLENRGVEVAVNAITVKNKDWEWSVGANFTYNAVEITQLKTISSDIDQVNAADIDRKYLQVHKIGETPNTYFLMRQAYDENGKALEGKYIAPDGSITTDVSDKNKYITGKSPRVPYYYGFNTHVKYKQWDFGMNAYGSTGNYIFNYQQAKQNLNGVYSDKGSFTNNVYRSALERGFQEAQYFSDMFLESGSFFRLDNITLGYSIPKLWNTKSNLRMAFSMQNVALITNYSGGDPEMYGGLDNSRYQRPKMYTLSLNLNF